LGGLFSKNGGSVFNFNFLVLPPKVAINHKRI
jgi:hypothetical protein